jgi:hypothetical protein
MHFAIRISAWLLLFLPLVSLTALSWQEYLRVVVLTVSLGYGLTTKNTHCLPANWKQLMLTVSLLFISSQFVLLLPINKVFYTSFGLLHLSLSLLILSVLAATPVVFLAVNSWGVKLILLDRLVVAIGLLLFLLSIGLKFAFEEETTWLEEILPAGLVVIWFFNRQAWVLRNFAGRNYWAGLVTVFTVVALVGCLQIGRAHYYTLSGARNIEKSDLNTALQQYANLEQLSESLGLESLHDKSALGQALIYHKQGVIEEASRALSMGDSFQIVVTLDELEGPVGSMLYKNTSCWVDLKLYAGKIQVVVFARGQPAQNIWPRMRVRLGDQILGEVDVTSGETRPYRFTAPTHTERSRLEISFLNDLWQLGVFNRDLFIEQVEITYQEIDW